MTEIVDENRSYCRALYNFRSEYPGEINFSAGDIIFLYNRVNDEWFNGECQTNGQKGILPVSFVEIVVPLPDEHEHETKTSSSEGDLRSIGIASVLYDFESRFPDELSVKAGESVQVLALADAEWAKCRDSISNKIGIIPQGFLHIFLDSVDSCEITAPVVNNESIASWPALSSLQQIDHQPFTTSSHLHPPLPQSILSNTLSDWSNPWDDGKSGNFNSIPRKASAPNLAAPPRPPPPKMETPAVAPRPVSLVTPGQLSVTAVSTSLVKPKKNGTASLKSSSSSSLVAFRRRKSLHAEKQRWNGEEFEEGQEADESLISALSMTPTANPHIQLDTSTASQSDAKTKVLLDLLNTERTYLFDLETWESCIQESKELSDDDKKTLTNGYPVLKTLSHSLINSLNAQKDLPVGEQTLGEVFMQLKDQFSSAFANHFRCVEQITAIVESEEDHKLQRALQSCVQAGRLRGSNCFDVPTAVSRPIQRCLKYPLYVGELLKNTPINHPDHPKLMEALRQQANLATRMNECKRRKELVRKYKGQEQLSLTDRLSRLNMHSLVKKSNRLKFRINRTMGFGTVKDSEFDYLIQLLEEAERRLCKFLYCTQLYKKHLEMAMKRQEDSYKGVCQVSDEKVVKAFAQMFRRVDEIYRTHMHTFEQEVISEGKRLVRSELTKLIHKRFDKLADFEAAKANSKNADEVERRRNEFEALNNQIKAQLPRLISTINKRVLQLIQRVNEMDQQFLRQMDIWWENERPEKVRQSAPMAPPFRAHLSISMKHTLVEMDKIAAFLYQRQGHGNTAAGDLAMARKKSLRLSLKAKPGHKKAQRGRPQTMKERDALVKICRAQNQIDKLRRVRRNWEGVNLVLREGDVLWVKAIRQDGFCLCDNAVSIDLVPIELLAPIEMMAITEQLQQPQTPNSAVPTNTGQFHPTNSNAPLSPTLLDQMGTFTSNSLSNPISPSPLKCPASAPVIDKMKKPQKEDSDLIDLEENLIDLNSPPKAVTDTYQQKRPKSEILTLLDYEHEPTRVIPSAKQLQSACPQSDDPFDELFNVVATQLSSSSSSSSEACKMSPPVPEIPDRPMATCNANFESLWSLPTPAAVTPQPAAVRQLDHKTVPDIQPIRIAPPPPCQKKRNIGASSNYYQNPPLYSMPPSSQPSVPSIQQKSDQASVQSATPTLSSYYSLPPAMPANQPQQQCGTFAISIFDFEPTGNGQMAIKQGDIVEVIQRSDDANNDQWWKVREVQSGTQGFVPANYLMSLNNTRV